MSCKNVETLKKALKLGIINEDTIWMQVEDMEKNKYLEMHTYSKWEGKDGFWHTYLPDKEKGRVRKKRKTEDEINKLIIDYWKQKDENPKIKEVFAEWNDRRLELKKICAATHIRNQQYFDRHYDEFGEKRIKDIDDEEIIDFLEEQIPRFELTSKAFSNIKGITKGFMKRAKKRKLIDWNIEEAFFGLDISDAEFKINTKDDCEEVFDVAEMKKIMNYLKENQDVKNLGILLMFLTGIRVGELVSLRHESIADGYIIIHKTETRYSKEKGTNIYAVKDKTKTKAGMRKVVIPPAYEWILLKLNALNPSGEYIFTNDRGERMTTNCFRRRLKRICEKLGIIPKSPHKIRKTYGSILLDNHADKKFVERQMGHTDISMTEDAYHKDRKNLEEKRKVLGAIEEFAAV